MAHISYISLLLATLICNNCLTQDLIRGQLDGAKSRYDESKKTIKREIDLGLSNYDQNARQRGDKKAVDRIKAEKEAWEQSGEFPMSVLDYKLYMRISRARHELISEFRRAIRDYTKVREDQKANKIEEEMIDFIKSISGDTLSAGMYLKQGATLVSKNGKYELTIQTDGNVVINKMPEQLALWGTATNKNDGKQLLMQGDGNLVLFNSKNRPVWSSNTAGHPNAKLVMQIDGNLVIQKGDKAIWSSSTHE